MTLAESAQRLQFIGLDAKLIGTGDKSTILGASKIQYRPQGGIEDIEYDVPQKLDSEIAQLTVDWKRYEKHVQPGIQSESGARGTARRQDTQPGGSRTWTAS